MKLSIVIPALNEELAVGGTIERCFEVCSEIKDQTMVKDVEIVVVSDGSTDRTPEIARSYQGVRVIEFKKNRGYGAAIKEGWRVSNGDLLSFLDADGTCDPKFFIPMCNMLEERQSDVVIGSRMGPDSKMPPIRRFGNLLYTALLGLLSRRRLTDTASGIRIVRKSSLNHIYPLPDGLHFTPAMSARVLMDRELRIDEVPISYKDRIGQSKLRVLQDGFRFLRIILLTALYTRPSRLTLPLVCALFATSLWFGFVPIVHYLKNQALLESMIHQFTVIFLLGTIGVTIFCSTIVAERVIELSLQRYDRTFRREEKWWWGSTGVRFYVFVALGMMILSCLLIAPGILTYLSTGRMFSEVIHWSRMFVWRFSVFTFFSFLTTAVLLNVIEAQNVRQSFLRNGLNEK